MWSIFSVSSVAPFRERHNILSSKSSYFCWGNKVYQSWKWKCWLLSCVQIFVTPVDASPSGSSVHGIFLARILEWVTMPFSGGFPDPRIRLRDQTQVFCTAGRFFTVWATREAIQASTQEAIQYQMECGTCFYKRTEKGQNLHFMCCNSVTK